jgi:succinate-semialdehyde dehydrogenase / glutarate-semialdehyde dehydrogenase
VWGSVVNTGQSCLSIERVYVARSRFDAFLTAVVTRARSIELAWPDDRHGPIGPVIAEKQVAVLEAQLADAIAQGARVHCGGVMERHGGGYWLRPTVVTNVHHGMRLMTEETFGPIIPLMSFESTDEGVSLANDSIYGLSAAIFAGTIEEAVAVADQLDAGAISINDAALTAVMHEGEKHAFKLSGLGGSRMGPASIRRFLRQKSYLIRQGTGRDPWWFADAPTPA